MLFYWIAGVLLALLWFSRVIETARGLPRIPDISLGDLNPDVSLPRLTVIVPARNEEEAIEQCLTSLLALDYPDFEVIAVDDRSTDSTGTIIDRLAAAHSRLKVIHVTELPSGWMGKTHAMWRAGELAARKPATGNQATRNQANNDLLLFTDGDVSFRPDSLRRAVTYMQTTQADHLVLFPTMIFKSPGEKMMLSFFHAALSFAHRPWKVSDPNARDHIGVGAFNLVRRTAYQAIGTYLAMQMEVIDDLQLGKLIKLHRLKQHAVLGPGLVTIHWATGAMGVVRSLGKNSFALLRFQWLLVLGGCIAIGFITLGPLLGLVLAPGWAKLGYGVALAAMASLYFQVQPITTIAPAYFLLHPFAAGLTIYALLRSAWLTSRHGVTWRGTSYPLQQFKNMKNRE